MTQNKQQAPTRIADEQLDAVTGGAFRGGVRVAAGDVNGDGVATGDLNGDGVADVTGDGITAPKKSQFKTTPASGKLGS